MPDAKTDLRSWIDSPASPEVDTTRLVVRGWCYARTGEKLKAIRARVGGKTHPGLYGLQRTDVFDVYKEAGAEISGYQIAVSLPARGGKCRLEVQVEAGEWLEFAVLDLKPKQTPSFAERWRWVRFWWLAWQGKAAAWELVGDAEQDYLVAWARHRGWLSLGVFDQYPPRPVHLEAFPKSKRTAAERPKITIVTPSYNQAHFLEATALSILQEEGVCVDYIIQDGGSKDESAEVVKRLAQRYPKSGDTVLAPRVSHWESKKDKGQADALKKGFLHTDCGPNDLMAYLNSDDVLMPGALRFVADYFAQHPEVDAVYGHRVLIDDKGAETGRWITPRRSCDDLRYADLVPQETLFWRKRLWDRVGGIDTSFHFALDWDLLLRFEAAGAKLVRLPWFLGMFRIHPQQKTQAWLERVGVPEMERLRERSLGRKVDPAVLHTRMRQVQFDSALVYALLKSGWRV